MIPTEDNCHAKHPSGHGIIVQNMDPSHAVQEPLVKTHKEATMR